MATAWSILELEIQKWVDNTTGTFKTSGAGYSYLLNWGNKAVRHLHQSINMAYKLQYAPSSLTYTTTDYQKALPTDFFKKSERFTYVKSGDIIIPIIGLDVLNSLDPNHDDTTSATAPDFVAIDAGRLFVYPMFAGTIKIEGYYTIPTDMTGLTSNPDVPNSDDALAQEAIIAYVVKNCFRMDKSPELSVLWDNEFLKVSELYRVYLGQSNSKINIVKEFY